MTFAERHQDIVKLLRGADFEIMYVSTAGINFRHTSGDELFLDERLVALFDARYQDGFKYGFERGAYEEQQQEDV